MKEGSEYYLLSRPRRFAKLLLIYTIRYLFEAQKELFKDLYIENKWNWSETYPIIRISFAKDIKNKQDLKNKIYQELEKNYLKYSLKIPKEIKDNTDLFEKLTIKLSEIKHTKVVILVGEYDKPILDLIENTKKQKMLEKN